MPIAPDGEPSVHSIYADGLWIGGISPDDQLHFSGVTYNQDGSDYFAGPLKSDGSASTTSEVCGFYDAVYKVNKADVLLHDEYHTRLELVSQGADPSILSESPFEEGYMMPSYFSGWPATNPLAGYEYYLAPFFDRDGDGEYDPEQGDYPYFDLTGEFNCQDYSSAEQLPLLGHQAIWYVANDASPHTEFGGDPLGIELQVTTFGYSACDELDESTFVRYQLVNRSSTTYQQCHIGKWTDVDIGCSEDDYVGCDVERGLAYGYNGDMLDESCGASGLGYGEFPPAVGVDILLGPEMDADGSDNPFASDAETALAANGIVYPGQGRGFGDGVVDNERMGMTSFLYYNIGSDQINGDINIDLDGYYYSQGIYKDGSSMTHGGTGVGGDIVTNYMFPGDTDPLGYGTAGEIENNDWSEMTEANPPGDRRFVQGSGSFTLEPGESTQLICAYVWA